MLKDVFVLYLCLDDDRGERSDAQGQFYKRENAYLAAQRLANRTRRAVSIDHDIWEITRSGRECVDSQADIRVFEPEGA